jgi:hypothetical protein
MPHQSYDRDADNIRHQLQANGSLNHHTAMVPASPGAFSATVGSTQIGKN